jgi:hypothetical protein
MNDKIDKPYISPSQLDMYTKCGEQYRRRYIEKHKIPPGIALIKGSSVHGAAALNYQQKVESKTDLPTKSIVECSVAAFENITKADGVLLSEEEESVGQAKVLGDAKDSTARMAGEFAEKIAPTRQPVAVEITQRIEIPESPYDLLGILDQEYTEGLGDLKTGKKKLSQEDIDKSIQFSFYALTFKARHKKDPRIFIDNVTDGKSGASSNQMETSRNGADYKVLVNRINNMIGGLRAGIFTPAPVGAWWCSDRFCGYWKTCCYVSAERKAATATVEND